LVAEEAGDPAVGILLGHREVVELLQPIEAVEMDDARRGAIAGGLHEHGG
jgi:hypothetical protein